MKKIVVLRFGPPIPIPEINQALRPHFANDQSAKAFPVPGRVMSVFNTDSTPEQIAESIKALSLDIPFFVFPYDRKASSLPQPLEDAINSESVPSNSAQPTAPALTVDQILEKISEHRIESLTEVERATLNASRSEG